MEYYSALKRNESLTTATTCIQEILKGTGILYATQFFAKKELIPQKLHKLSSHQPDSL
jgi:hypothetical protein